MNLLTLEVPSYRDEEQVHYHRATKSTFTNTPLAGCFDPEHWIWGMKTISKSRNELLKAWVVNFHCNIDKAADVTVFAVVFLSPLFFYNCMPNADVIKKFGEKKCAPLFSPPEEKTLLNHLSVACVNSTRCAHHMCTIYLSKSRYLSLFVFCHGKWVAVGQRFAQCWKDSNDDELTLYMLLLLWNHIF